MRRRGDRVEFGMRECSDCGGRGTVPTQKPCPRCKGTGNGLRGARGQCRQCHGFKTVHDFDHPTLCKNCSGSGQQAETADDYLPAEMWQELPFRVYRADRPNTWNEEHLALGCLCSCTDYGTAWEAGEDHVISRVRNFRHRPKLDEVWSDGRWCDHIAITLTQNGYSVKAVWDDVDPTRDLPTEQALARLTE